MPVLFLAASLLFVVLIVVLILLSFLVKDEKMEEYFILAIMIDGIIMAYCFVACIESGLANY